MLSPDRPREHHVLLFSVLGLMLLVLGVLGWNLFHQSSTRFRIGNAPPSLQEDAQTKKPTLPPESPKAPVRGPEDPRYPTVTLFADYTCLYCRGVAMELERVAAGGIAFRYVWRDLPHTEERPDGIIASAAARCAQDQGKFWQLHPLLLTAKSFDLKSLQSLATQAGLDLPRFNACMDSGEMVPSIQQEAEVARQSNITGTPTLFIGSTVIEGYVTAEELRGLIQRSTR